MTVNDDYATEKLKFVSNLNGTTLNEIVTLLSLFPLINFLSCLIKSLLLFYVGSSFIKQLNSQRSGTLKYFCKSYFIDFVTCIVPLVLVCTSLSNQKVLCQFLLMASVVALYKFIMSVRDRLVFPIAHFSGSSLVGQTDELSFDSVEEMILRLSIKTCRLWLYLFTAVCILGVDFKIFPRENAKTETFGVSAMDLGVGFYIVCHSMRIVRNEEISSLNKITISTQLKQFPSDLFKTLKSSSFLLAIGFGRLYSIKATNYVEHVSEYGVHWNFLFTIVLVKLIACPLQVFIAKSSIRSFLIGAVIAFYYQFFLTKKNYTAYLLNDFGRKGFVDANKEGIYSCLGYVAIYLCSQAIFLQLSSILNRNKRKSMKANFNNVIKCILFLILVIIFYFIILMWSSQNVQNVSRRLCNLSFISFTLFACTILLTFYTIAILLISKYCAISNTELTKPQIAEAIAKLKLIFSFAEIIDSKYTGLVTFLLSNILTGAVNLSMNTLGVSDQAALVILFGYCLISFALPNFFYYYFNFRWSERSLKKD